MRSTTQPLRCWRKVTQLTAGTSQKVPTRPLATRRPLREDRIHVGAEASLICTEIVDLCPNLARVDEPAGTNGEVYPALSPYNRQECESLHQQSAAPRRRDSDRSCTRWLRINLHGLPRVEREGCQRSE